MSQASIVLANNPGATFRTALNSALQALITNNSGPTAPTTTYANMLWYDTANNVLKIRNEGNTDWNEVVGDSVEAPATNTNNYIPQWDGTNSKLLKDGIEKSTDGTMSGNSDNAVPTEKAVKTFVEGASVNDHGDLEGLSGDDHPQYLNTARHDADDHSSLTISSGQLNISSNSGSGEGSTLITGAAYGFQPRFKRGAASTQMRCLTGYGQNDVSFEQYIDYKEAALSYASYAIMAATGSGVPYYTMNYVTSSGKDHWIFILIDKATGKICGMTEAPDHPSYGNGDDENEFPHPFGHYNADKHEILLADNLILNELRKRVTSRKSLSNLVMEDCLINNHLRPKYQPRESIYIDMFGEQKGKTIRKIKTKSDMIARLVIPAHVKEFELKQRFIEKLPDHIQFKSLRLKGKGD